jgi:hypothetical protein
MALKMWIVVLWVVTPFSLVDVVLKMKAIFFCETLAPLYKTALLYNPENHKPQKFNILVEQQSEINIRVVFNFPT